MTTANPYESDKLLAEYLLFHFGEPEDILPPGAPTGMREALDFAVRTQAHFATESVARGLDLGCAVGRSTYEMSRHCEEVIGIDFSQAFVTAAAAVGLGPLAYRRHDEGHLDRELVARLPDGIDPGRARFEQGDAMDLRDDLGRFERVHAANLLCRLTEPQRLLERLPDLLIPGGELVIATPCTWLGEFTPPRNWPPGRTIDWLDDSLASAFERRDLRDEPFLIRETARKFQWTRSQLSLWRRR